jgi:demethylmenaquinone methyltransferase / 2-methoxy-6-polyprenyl-1,4-benzoquinol methylase
MSSINASTLESSSIRKFFDTIAYRYDFLNTFLSFKLDDRWRARSRDLLLEPSQKSVLDLGIGTGKFLDVFLKAKSWNRAAGLDFSSAMLNEASRQLPPNVEFINGDFQALPFSENSFDLIVSAFTLRSVRKMPEFLAGVYKILNSNGRVGFLCLTRPTNFFWKFLYYPYLKFYLPLIGGLFSGNRKAYEFLSESILTFQDPHQTKAMMKEIGFKEVDIRYFSFGMATLIRGRK